MSDVVLWAGMALLGGLGAVLRFGLDGVVQERIDSELPLGTLVVNGLGAFLLGLLTGLGVSADGLLLLGVAGLGSFTTFSTWMLESERLAEDGAGRLAVVNLVGSVAVGLTAAGAGWAIGALL